MAKIQGPYTEAPGEFVAGGEACNSPAQGTGRRSRMNDRAGI